MQLSLQNGSYRVNLSINIDPSTTIIHPFSTPVEPDQIVDGGTFFPARKGLKCSMNPWRENGEDLYSYPPQQFGFMTLGGSYPYAVQRLA